VASWRGGENKLGNYRSPSVTGYWYSSYLIGPFAPAIGVAATGWKDHDRDYFHGGETFSPLFSVAPTVSLEWATPAAAVLLGATLPYQYDGHDADASNVPRSPWSWGGWVVALGVALSPF
jgi:hypothetical protein